MTVSSMFFRLVRSTRGVVTLDYAIVLAFLTMALVGFGVTTSGVLRGGLDATQADLARVDSLDSVVGPVVTAPAATAIHLDAGAVPSAIVGEPYSFSFARYLQAPAALDRTQLQWTLQSDVALPPGFSFDTATGTLRGQFAGGPAVTAVLRVGVGNGAVSAEQTYTWTAREAGLFLRPAQLPLIVPGEPYRFDFSPLVEWPDDIAPDNVVWRFSSGTLPQGLVLGADVPSLSGVYTGPLPAGATITAEVSTGPYVAVRSYVVATVGLWLEPAPDREVAGGEGVSWDFRTLLHADPAITGGGVAWDLEVEDAAGAPAALPAGVEWGAGLLSGRARVLEDTARVLRVRARAGDEVAERTYRVVFLASTVVLEGGELAPAQAFVPYTANLSERLSVSAGLDASGAVWTVAGGALPPGFALNASTGALTGRFTHTAPASYTFDITAAVAGLGSDTAAFVLAIEEGDGLDSDALLSTAYYGVLYSFDLKTTLTSATPSEYRWRVSGAPLPVGLSLDEVQGTISGVPMPLEDHLGMEALTLIVEATNTRTGAVLSASMRMGVDGLAPFRVTAAGGNSCALDERGEAWCWGRRSSNGILGNPDTTSGAALAPELVSPTPQRFVDIDMSRDSACGLDSDGQIWCWGSNTYGQLGNGTTGNSTATPTRVDQSAMGLGAVSVSVGLAHTCAISAAAEVWCWGDGGSGRLGNGYTWTRSVPVRVLQSSGMTAPVARISAGNLSTCAVDVQRAAWCWGLGSHGRLGQGSTSSASSPVRVSSASGLTEVLDIVAANVVTCAISVEKRAWCWGEPREQRLGAPYSSLQLLPVLVPAVSADGEEGPTMVDRIYGADALACALREADGAMWCWGPTDYGRLGNGKVDAGDSAPTRVRFPALKGKIVGADTGILTTAHTCAWTDAREALCWGWNAEGQVGKPGSPSSVGIPVFVDFPNIIAP